MAFNNNPPKQNYQATAGQTAFSFIFKIYTDDDLVVYKQAEGEGSDTIVPLLLGVDYTATIDGDNGGVMTLNVGATLNDTIIVYRGLDVTRLVDYQTSGDLLANTLNADQDYQTYLISDLSLHLEETISGISPGNPSAYVLKTGDTLTGALRGIAPVDGADLTRKDYVDNSLFVNANVVDTVAELGTQDGLHETIVVQEEGRGGTFNYDASRSGENDNGTVFNGWVRQYTGLFESQWFGYDSPYFYVSTTGSDTADGFTISTPFLTIQKAFDELLKYNINKDQTATVELADGTYTEGASMNTKLTDNRIVVKGSPKDSTAREVPTAIIDGTTATKANGLYFLANMYVMVQDIKVQHFTNSTVSCGVVVDNGSNLYCKNVHTYNNSWCGLNASGRSQIYVESGIQNANRYGIRAYTSSSFSIGYNGNATDNRPYISNSTEDAIHIMSSQGHIDYTDIDNDTVGGVSSNKGIYLYNQARAHILGCDIKNCNNGIRLSTGSTYGASTPSTFTNCNAEEVVYGNSVRYEDNEKYYQLNDPFRIKWNGGESGATYLSASIYTFETDASITNPSFNFTGGGTAQPELWLGNSTNYKIGGLASGTTDSLSVMVDGIDFCTFYGATNRITPKTTDTHSLGFVDSQWQYVYAQTYMSSGQTGKSGTFTTNDGKTITVTGGIITGIA